VADQGQITVICIASGAWLVEPVGGTTTLEEVKAFAQLDKAAAYAASLVLKHRISAIIMPPLVPDLDS
jgi:hypothetical protein